MAVSICRSGTALAAGLLKAMPSAKPQSTADKLAVQMLTHGGARAPTQGNQSQPGVYCPSCGSSHKPGVMCSAVSKSDQTVSGTRTVAGEPPLPPLSMVMNDIASGKKAKDIVTSYPRGWGKPGGGGNPYHDPKTGKFASKDSSGGGDEAAPTKAEKPQKASVETSGESPTSASSPMAKQSMKRDSSKAEASASNDAPRRGPASPSSNDTQEVRTEDIEQEPRWRGLQSMVSRLAGEYSRRGGESPMPAVHGLARKVLSEVAAGHAKKLGMDSAQADRHVNQVVAEVDRVFDRAQQQGLKAEDVIPHLAKISPKLEHELGKKSPAWFAREQQQIAQSPTEEMPSQRLDDSLQQTPPTRAPAGPPPLPSQTQSVSSSSPPASPAGTPPSTPPPGTSPQQSVPVQGQGPGAAGAPVGEVPPPASGDGRGRNPSPTSNSGGRATADGGGFWSGFAQGQGVGQSLFSPYGTLAATIGPARAMTTNYANLIKENFDIRDGKKPDPMQNAAQQQAALQAQSQAHQLQQMGHLQRLRNWATNWAGRRP